MRDLQRIEPDHALHRPGDRCGERGRGGVGKGGAPAGDPVAPERGGKRRGHRARRRGDIEGQAIGGQRAGAQALSLQGGPHARHLGDPGGEAPGELGDAQIVVIQGEPGVETAWAYAASAAGSRGWSATVASITEDCAAAHHGRSRRQGRRERGRRASRRRPTRRAAGRPRRRRRGRPTAADRRDERGGEAVDDSRGQAQIHGGSSSGWRATPSRRAACCQGLRRWCEGADRGAVSRMNRSRAATTAAASSVGGARGDDRELRTSVHRVTERYRQPGVSPLPVLDYPTILSAVPPADADCAGS